MEALNPREMYLCLNAMHLLISNDQSSWSNGDLWTDGHLVLFLRIHSTSCAFAALLGDGSLVTWGDPHSGGDSQEVNDELHDVRQAWRRGGGGYSGRGLFVLVW